MHEKHLAYINDNNDAVEKSAYTTLRSTVQKKLRGMQEDWWRDKARELQDAVDRHDMKAFYHNLRAERYWQHSSPIFRWHDPHHRP